MGVAQTPGESQITAISRLLMVCVDAQAQIAFVSDRDGNFEIYVMSINGNVDSPRAAGVTGHRHGPPMASALSSGRDGNREIYVMDADGVIN